jgi:uncharacterized membrane protein HdeD (DUF308 family)
MIKNHWISFSFVCVFIGIALVSSSIFIGNMIYLFGWPMMDFTQIVNPIGGILAIIGIIKQVDLLADKKANASFKALILGILALILNMVLTFGAFLMFAILTMME